MAEYNKKQDDGGKTEIDQLIKSENDPKTRAILLVLQNINVSLMANTQAVNDTDNQLKQHMIEVQKRAEENTALMNRGRGMWQVISGILVFAQMGLIYFMSMYLADIKDLHAKDVELDNRITIIEHK